MSPNHSHQTPDASETSPSLASWVLSVSASKAWIRLWVLGLGGFGCLAYHHLFYRSFFDPKLALLAWSTLAIVPIALLTLARSRPAIQLSSYSQIASALVLGGLVIGTIWHQGDATGPLTSPDWVPWAVLGSVGLALAVLPSTVVFKVWILTAFVATMAAIIGLFQAAGWDPLAWMASGLGTQSYHRMPASTFGNPNYGSLTLVPVFGGALGLVIHGFRHRADGLRWGGMLFWSLVAIVCLAYVAVSQSRGGALACLTIVLSLLAHGNLRNPNGDSKGRSYRTPLILAVSALAMIMTFWYSGTAQRLTGAGQQSLGYRMALWSDVGRQVARAPILGIGGGRLPDILGEQASVRLRSMPSTGFANERFDLAHQDWLQIAVARGIPVALLALSLWLWAGWLLWQAGRNPGIRWPQASAAKAGLGAWVGASCLTLADFPFHYPPAAWVTAWWVLGGLVLSRPPRIREGLRSIPQAVGTLSWFWAISVTLLLLGWLRGPALSDPMASWALGAARQAQRAGDRVQVEHLALVAEKWGADAGLVGQIRVGAARLNGDAAQAVAHARKWVSERPWDSDGWNSLGAAQGESGDWDGALQSLKRAWELSPANGAAALNVAVIYHSQGQWKPAVEWFEKVWATHPDLFQKETARYEEARSRLSAP